MKTICAWCGKLLKDGPDKPVSHGMCRECSDRELAKLGKVIQAR